MKEKIGLTIAGVSLLLSCVWVYLGCQPPRGYIRVDSKAGVMHPTFRFYQDASFQERLEITHIAVWKVRGSPEFDSQWEERKVWSLYSIQNRLTSPIRRLTYGEVPPGYREGRKAEPLEPEQFYSVRIHAPRGVRSEDRYFIIRLDATGTPQRLESH